MHPYALFTLLVALLAGCMGDDQKYNRKKIVYKCCDEYEMLSGDGRSCVQADWPRHSSFKITSRNHRFQAFFPPLNEDWVRRWLPPGLPLHRIEAVIRMPFSVSMLPVRVNASFEVNRKTKVKDILRTKVAFLEDMYVARPKPGGRLRKGQYCVDAALSPMGPFAMRLRTNCYGKGCVNMCCDIGQVMVNKEGNWMCEENDQGDWTLLNVSFAKHVDPETPFQVMRHCSRMRLAKPQDFSARLGIYPSHDNLFSILLPCTAYRRNHSTLQEGEFYCEYPRVARGIYWMLRPLCLVSALLLAMALLGIACDGSMRRKVHGWCLAGHALCLFGFNVGQIVYYVHVSQNVIMTTPTPDIEKLCKHFALTMYFLLLAAWFWLTALCTNMALGFRLQAALPRRGDKKRFLVFSVLAWGLPALLTITCSLLLPRDPTMISDHSPWKPSLVEARVCFSEPAGLFFDLDDKHLTIPATFSHKYGTATFYYCPVLSLMLCNVASLSITLRKIKRLRRGNSVLRREEDLRRRQPQGNPPSAANIESAIGGTCESGNGDSKRREVDTKAIKMYLKMILMTGAIEIISEVIIWATTKLTLTMPDNFLWNDTHLGVRFTVLDYNLPYRSSGHVTDFLRAACVAWLAAPEGGYLGPILRRLRGEKKQKVHLPFRSSWHLTEFSQEKFMQT